jgi:hypothetical protein
MVNYPAASNFSTPQRRRPSDPTWSTRMPPAHMFTPSRSSQTPRSGKKTDSRTAGIPKSRYIPYMTPELVKIRIGPGESRPMELLTPKDWMAKRQEKAANSKSSPMTPLTGSTNTPGRARLPGSKRRTPLNPDMRIRSPSPSLTLVSPPMQGTPRRGPKRRPLDPARPTVQLLRVLSDCLSDDTSNQSNWTMRNERMNGRNEDRDTRGKWDTLGRAVRHVWPELLDWIMRCTPWTNDDDWFSLAGLGDGNRVGYITDPTLATKDSSLDRVGFHSSFFYSLH